MPTRTDVHEHVGTVWVTPSTRVQGDRLIGATPRRTVGVVVDVYDRETSASIQSKGPAVKWSILEGLPEDQQRAVLASCTRRRYARGDTLFHEGDAGSSLHLLDTGRVAVRVSTPLGDVATLTVLRSGDVFGEQALLEAGAARTASIVALEPVETLTLHHRDFDQLRRDHPTVERMLVTLLAAQVRRLSLSLTEALYLPAEKRVLRRLVDLCAIYRPLDAAVDGAVIIALTQEDLATMAGTTRPTVNRALQEAVAAGYVALGRGRIEITDPHALARHAR